MLIIDAHTHVFGLCDKGISTGEKLVKCMDDHSVNKSILIGNPYYGFFNEITKKCCLDYPERFIGVVSDYYRENLTGLVLCAGIELLAKFHDVNTLRTKCRSYWG